MSRGLRKNLAARADRFHLLQKQQSDVQIGMRDAVTEDTRRTDS